MLAHTLLEQFKIRLRKFTTDSDGVVTFDNSEDLLLQQLIDEAVNDVIIFRQYPPSYDSEMIEKDLRKFNSVILKLALYDYNKEGSEFESTNTENGDTRTYITRQSILNDITPFITVLN